MDGRFQVTVGAGTMMSASAAAARFPHRWTPGCVLNDLYREAASLGIELSGVRVTAAGGFDTSTWQSTGIGYSVEVSSDAPADQLTHLVEVVDQVAEIPRAIRAGATVQRVH
jgi:hypothetical protein